MEERWHSPEIGDQTGVETKTGMKKIMDLLKKKKDFFVILEAVAFNILVKIPSAPVAFDESNIKS